MVFYIHANGYEFMNNWYTDDMNSQEEMKEIQDLRSRFRAHMGVLWERKRQLFSLFRSRLEEKKIEEIKENLSK